MDSTLFSTLLVLFVVSLTRQQVDVNSPDCGLSQIEASPASDRISGGEEVPFGQFPWLANVKQLMNQIYSNGSCVATVIDRQWLLTSCVCVEQGLKNIDVRSLVAFVGNVSFNETTKSGIRYEIVKKESLFDANAFLSWQNDVCLLQTAREIDFDTPFVNSICLQEKELNTSDSFVAAGFAWSHVSSTFRPHVIRQNRIVGHDRCKAHADEILAREGRTYQHPSDGLELGNFTEKAFCRSSTIAGGPCFTQLSEPMMVLRNGRWFLVGLYIIFYRPNQPIADYPCGYIQVFINISAHLPRIKRIITQETPPTEDYFFWYMVGLIVGLIVGVLALVACVWFLVVRRCKKKQQEKRQRKQRSSDSENGTTRTRKSTTSGSFTVSSTSEEKTNESTGSLEPLEKRVPRLQKKTPAFGKRVAKKKKPVESEPLPKSTDSIHYSLEKLTFSSEKE